MPLPVAAAIIAATALAEGSRHFGQHFANQRDEKQSKKVKKANKKFESRRAKESKRETQAGLIEDAMKRSADSTNAQIEGQNKLTKRKVRSRQETADLVREALNI